MKLDHRLCASSSDQGTPAPLREALAAHSVETAYERGWSSLSNGDLLTAAEDAFFDVLVTTDQNLRYQQNVQTRQVAILVLPTTRWPIIQQHVLEIVTAISSIRPGEFRQLVWSNDFPIR